MKKLTLDGSRKISFWEVGEKWGGKISGKISRVG